MIILLVALEMVPRYVSILLGSRTVYQTQRSSSYSIRIPAENHTRNQALTDIWSWIYVISEIVYVQAHSRPVFEEASADQATAVTFAIVIILIAFQS